MSGADFHGGLHKGQVAMQVAAAVLPFITVGPNEHKPSGGATSFGSSRFEIVLSVAILPSNGMMVPRAAENEDCNGVLILRNANRIRRS